MAAKIPRYLTTVVIESGVNDKFVVYDSGTNYTVTLPSGSYYISGDGTTTDLLKKIETAVENITGFSWTFTVNSTYNVRVTATGSSGGTWGLTFNHANQTFDETILGFTEGYAATTVDGAYLTSTNQHIYQWYGNNEVEWDDGKDDQALDEQSVSQNRAVSGVIHTVSRGSYEVRKIDHRYEPPYKAWEVTGYENQSWKTFWNVVKTGKPIRYYPDSSDTSTYWTGVLTGSSLESTGIEREDKGLDLYSWTVRMRKYVESS